MPYNPSVHGVSYSMLSDFLTCRQKARFRIQGVRPKRPAMALAFGTIMHNVLDQLHTKISGGSQTKVPNSRKVKAWVEATADRWLKENPKPGKYGLEDLELALGFAEALTPEYFRFWRKKLLAMEWLGVEQFHKFPIQISGSVTAKVNTKLDGEFALRSKKRPKVKSIWLLETKCLSYINIGQLMDSLQLSMQNAIYLMSLADKYGKDPKGVRYNILRRPQLRRKKTESLVEFIERVRDDVKTRPEHYFIHLRIPADKDELARARGHLQLQLNEFLHWHDGERGHYRNTNACVGMYGACTYLPICANNDWTGFLKRGKR